MNETEAKYYMQATRNRILPIAKRTSRINQSQADTDYQKKKEAQHKAVHDEIKRVSLQQSLI